MDLKISAFHLFVLFTAGHSLRCFQCWSMVSSCPDPAIKTCSIGYSKCTIATKVSNIGGARETKVTDKDCAVDCKSESMNFGTEKESYSCCDTDFCNVPDPSTDSPNGKTCYYCFGQNCSNTVSCSGSEDRCITITLDFNIPLFRKGCVSKSVCDAAASKVSKIKNVSCCSGNLCNSVNSITQNITQSPNGAQSITQSLFLCCSLLSFILLH